MARLATAKRFSFPYAIDVAQDVARAYGAVCTPEFFASTRRASCSIAAASTPCAICCAWPDTRAALRCDGGDRPHRQRPAEQHPDHGCSIKWRRE